MKKLQQYLPFHFLLCVILGICTQFYTEFWKFGFQLLSVVFILLLVSAFIFHKLGQKKMFTFCSLTIFFWVGFSNVYIKNPQNSEVYFAKHLTQNATATLQISKILKSSKFYNKYEAKITQINHKKTIGKVLLNLQKDSCNQFKINDLLLTASDFKEISIPKNPHQFDYKSYLAKQDIHHQLFINKNTCQIIGKKPFSILGFSEKIRNKVQKNLKKYAFSSNEFSVINALLLGQRNEISKELRENYTNAGAIHILAISGLHIGIILLLLLWVFKPLTNVKNGKIIVSILVVLLLWLFAIIAGLSASVVRAVTMFTFVAVGQLFNNKQPVEHSLITSMFVLLLINPMFLFDVGFQLSYLAVFGIVWLQPLFLQFWIPKSKFIYKIWQLTTVSLSAQIGVLPVSLYYFHQFPSLFLLSNLVIIPVLGSILFAGIAIIFLSLLNVLPQFLADFYGFIISCLNSFVSLIAQQEQFLLKEISISFYLMLALYGFIIFGTQFIIRRKPKQLIYLLFAIITIQSGLIFEKYQQKNTEEFIVFHKSKQSIFGKRKGKSITIYQNSDSLTLQNQPFLRNYKIGENVILTSDNTNRNILQYKNTPVLIVDSLGVYELTQLKNPIVLLSESPKINLNRLILKLNPKQIIADGSNYKSYVQRWKQTCKQKKTPFYSTFENGACVLK